MQQAKDGDSNGLTAKGQRFTSSQVVKLTGVTPRRLRLWDKLGMVVAQGYGPPRRYTLNDVTAIAVIGALQRSGFPFETVRSIIELLQKEFRTQLATTIDGGAEYHLLTDGECIYLANSDRQVIDILKNSRRPMLSVSLSDAVKGILAQVQVFGGQPNQVQPGNVDKRTGPKSMLAPDGRLLQRYHRLIDKQLIQLPTVH